MKQYEREDEVTFYFIIFTGNDKDTKLIQGWTDSRDIAKAYLDFHASKNLKMKSISGEYGSVIVPILNEAVHDEIQLVNIFIRDRKSPNKTEQITIPATRTEGTFIFSEEASYFSSRIDYTILNAMTPFMKNKWRRVLDTLHMNDVINQSIHSKPSTFTMNTKFDQLLLLVKSFPDYFGI